MPTFIITLCMALNETDLVAIVETHICVLSLYGLEISILAWRQIRRFFPDSELGNSLQYAYFDSEDEPKYILTPAELKKGQIDWQASRNRVTVSHSLDARQSSLSDGSSSQ